MSELEHEWVALASDTAPRYRFGSYPHQGVYHRARGARPSVAFVATHHVVDYTDHYMAGPLAERGFGFLGWNTRFRGDDAYFVLEEALIDIAIGVRWLREVQGVDTVVLLGNSGGGSLMATYQAQATDVSAVQPPAFGGVSPQVEELIGDLPGGDLYVSVNSHRGRPDVLTAWIDPAVVDELDVVATDPDLDLFDPRNGPPYSAEFLTRYREAQCARNRRITAWAQAELVRLEQFGIDDRTFVVNRQWADPRFVDLGIDPSDRAPGCYFGDPRSANYGSWGVATSCTLRGWLSMWSLDTAQCRGGDQLRHVDVPSLVVQSLGDQGVFPSDARAIHADLAAADKTLELVAGGHYFENDERALQHAVDLIAGWTSERVA